MKLKELRQQMKNKKKTLKTEKLRQLTPLIYIIGCQKIFAGLFNKLKRNLREKINIHKIDLNAQFLKRRLEQWLTKQKSVDKTVEGNDK